MESKEAFQDLLEISKQKKFDAMHQYLQNSNPVEIKISSLAFVRYLISVVVSQQLSTKAAKTIWSRVEQVLNQPLNLHTLEEDLRSAGLSRPKAGYVLGLLANKKLNTINKDTLMSMPPEDFENLLISNKGIGPWSVHMARMFYLGDSDILPINDLGIKHAHQKFFNGHEMEECFYEVFSPWRTYLSLIMWNSLS